MSCNVPPLSIQDGTRGAEQKQTCQKAREDRRLCYVRGQSIPTICHRVKPVCRRLLAHSIVVKDRGKNEGDHSVPRIKNEIER